MHEGSLVKTAALSGVTAHERSVGRLVRSNNPKENMLYHTLQGASLPHTIKENK